MRNYTYIFVFIFLSCSEKNNFYVGYSTGQKNKFYSVEGTSPIPSVPIIILCSNSSKEIQINNFNIVEFDSVDYYSFDFPYDKDQQPEFTLVTDEYEFDCQYPLALQISALTKVVSVHSLTSIEISTIKEIIQIILPNINQDSGFKYDLFDETRQEKYELYNIFHYNENNAFEEYIILIKDTKVLVSIML